VKEGMKMAFIISLHYGNDTRYGHYN